jgi:hypothetical protein
MAGFGISCIIIALLALAQGRSLTEVIGLIIQDLGG